MYFDCLVFQIKRVKDADEVPMVCKYLELCFEMYHCCTILTHYITLHKKLFRVAYSLKTSKLLNGAQMNQN